MRGSPFIGERRDGWSGACLMFAAGGTGQLWSANCYRTSFSPFRPDRDPAISAPRKLLAHKPAKLDGLRSRSLDRHRHDTIEQRHLDIEAEQVAPIHGPADLGSLLNGQRQVSSTAV
jgi:hypothetical protein